MGQENRKVKDLMNDGEASWNEESRGLRLIQVWQIGSCQSI